MNKDALLRDLMRASSSLLQIERNRDSYGQTFYVMAEGGVVPFEQARQEALDALSASLERCGVIYVPAEREAMESATKRRNEHGLADH